jgi:hypothetical protein
VLFKSVKVTQKLLELSENPDSEIDQDKAHFPPAPGKLILNCADGFEKSLFKFKYSE